MASNKVYSLTKGLGKAVASAAIFGVGAVATILYMSFPELNNLPLADLIDTGLLQIGEYLKMIVGTMTVGGVIALAANWLKIKYA